MTCLAVQLGVKISFMSLFDSLVERIGTIGER